MDRTTTFGSAPAKTLREAALVPEVRTALQKYRKNFEDQKTAPGVLIGGLALSFYTRPRTTTDIDMLYRDLQDIPDSIEGFRKIPGRKGNFQDVMHHVEIETLTPKSINIPDDVAVLVFRTAIPIDGILIASLEAMIVLKLFAADTKARRLGDMQDIVNMLKNVAHRKLDLSEWRLSEDHEDRLQECFDIRDAE